MQNVIKPKCLIVDDDHTFLVYLKVLIERNGFEVKHTSSATVAFEKLKKEKFNLIISDVEMPEVDGFELLSKIKSDSKLNEIPFIFVTNSSDAEYVSKAFSLGVNGFIKKPFIKQKIGKLHAMLNNLDANNASIEAS